MVARVAAVGKVEAVPVVSEVAQAVKAVDVQVVREAKAEAGVRVASAVRHREQGHGHRPKHRNKTLRQLAHGVCGSG